MPRHAFPLHALIVALLALGWPAAAGAAPPDPPAGATACNLGAWTNNDLPGPIVVRAAPAPDAPVIGTLPLTDRANDPVHEYSITFRITGTAPGWLRIARAQDRDLGDLGLKPRPVPAGEGWIPDDAARFGIQSARGHARPDPASPRLLDLGHGWLTELGRIERVLGCDGAWVLIEARLRLRREANDALTELAPADQPRLRAWFRGACPIEETTCDMPSVDE
jgi:hypothetical protein